MLVSPEYLFNVYGKKLIKNILTVERDSAILLQDVIRQSVRISILTEQRHRSTKAHFTFCVLKARLF